MMLLQTFIQLHILLAATPALAGWGVFAPASQPIPGHVLYLVAQTGIGSSVPASDRPQVLVIRVLPSPTTGYQHLVTVQPLPASSALRSPSTVDALPQNDLSYPHGPRAP